MNSHLAAVREGQIEAMDFARTPFVLGNFASYLVVRFKEL